MTELVEMLRRHAHHSGLFELAADEIERLRDFLKQVAGACERAEAEVLALRAENAELVESMCHPSYEVENRLRAELAALKSHTVDCIGIALELEDRAKTVESQTTERAMVAAVNALRLLAALKVTPPSVPEGWQLVPVKPTPEMLDSVRQEMTWCNPVVIFLKMLKAAPKPGDE